MLDEKGDKRIILQCGGIDRQALGVKFYPSGGMMRDKILNLLDQQGDIPPLSDILIRLNQKVEDPDCELGEIAALIETEPVLSGKLIKLANSVFFGGGKEQAKDLTTAIWRLGLKMILDLAYTLEVPKMFYKSKGFVQRQFWRHSLGVAILSQNLGARVISDRVERQHCYLAGLMHDLGILVFFFLLPKEYAQFLKGVSAEELNLAEQEELAFEIGHPELAAIFMEKWWQIAPPVIAAVQDHHMNDLRTGSQCAKVVCIANMIMNENGITNGTQTYFDPFLDGNKILDAWGLSLEGLESILAETIEALDNTELILNF